MGKSKYTLEFKLQAIERYKKELIGTDQLGKELGVSGSNIRKWIKFHELYGDEGLLRTNNQIFRSDFKLKVLSTIENQNLSFMEAARRFNISSESTIIAWRNNYEKSGILGLENKPRGRPVNMSQNKRKKSKSKKPLTREEELLERIYQLEAENAVLKKLDALTQERKKPKSSKS